jgi:hypothetical protein
MTDSDLSALAVARDGSCSSRPSGASERRWDRTSCGWYVLGRKPPRSRTNETKSGRRRSGINLGMTVVIPTWVMLL